MRPLRKKLPAFCLGGILFFLLVAMSISFRELPAQEVPIPPPPNSAPALTGSARDKGKLDMLLRIRGRLLSRKLPPGSIVGIDNWGRFKENNQIFVSP